MSKLKPAKSKARPSTASTHTNKPTKKKAKNLLTRKVRETSVGKTEFKIKGMQSPPSKAVVKRNASKIIKSKLISTTASESKSKPIPIQKHPIVTRSRSREIAPTKQRVFTAKPDA
jgi:hypothetical protein